jgi:hypothetical protein
VRAPSESGILKACLQLLAARGVLAWRSNSGAARYASASGKSRFVRFCGIEGLSDISGVLPGGRALYVETKRPGNVPTKKQQGFLDAVARQGGLAVVVTSAAELDGVLRELGVWS